MRSYLKLALCMCRISNTAPSFIVHPTDLIGCDQISALNFFPGMNICSDIKLKFFLSVINEFLKYYHLVGLYAFAESILKSHKTRVLPL
jgi:hypothetical protein